MNLPSQPEKSISALCDLLNCPKIPHRPKYRQVKYKMTYQKYLSYYNPIRKKIMKEIDDILTPYRVGTYKEWEGGAYYINPLYLYEGVYYG